MAKRRKKPFIGPENSLAAWVKQQGITPDPAPQEPTRPPYGSYDPTLDQQERSAGRGLADLLADIGTGDERALADYGLNRGDVQRNLDRALEDSGLSRQDYERSYGRGLEDIRTQRGRGQEDFDTSVGQLERSYGRNLGDLRKSRGRGQEDYDTNVRQYETQYGRGVGDLQKARGRGEEDYATSTKQVEQGFGRSLGDLLKARERGGQDYQNALQGLDRQYGRMANSQTQAQGKQGVSRGGALAQAMQKRQANQRLDRQPMDTNFSRFSEDSRSAQTRLGEDKAENLGGLARNMQRFRSDSTEAEGRMGQDRSENLGGMRRNLDRFMDDSTEAEGRLGEDRSENMGGLRRNLDRFLTDSTRAEGRMGEDKTTAFSRFDLGDRRNREDTGRQFGSLALNLGRGFEDRGVQGQRAQRENVFYGQDLNEVRVDQAKQMGALPDYQFGSQAPTAPPVTRPNRQRGNRPPGVVIGAVRGRPQYGAAPTGFRTRRRGR